MKRLFLKNKLIATFCLFVFLFAQIAPINKAYAFDINQAIGNVMDITKNISDAIETMGGGVIKAGIATALNGFAQTLATNTVDAVANNGKGQQPLFKQFSLEDTLKMAIDDATGSIIDQIATSGPEGQRLIDNVCSPIDANINWRLKMTLNIFPDFQKTNVNVFLAHNCTISTIVTSIKKSIENVSASLRKTFMKDCFDEFAPDMFAASIDPETGASSVIDKDALGKNFLSAIPMDYESMKSNYLYDVNNAEQARASYFTIKKVFYKQKTTNALCTSYSGSSDGSKFCTLDEFPTANSKSNCETESSLGATSINVGGVELNSDAGQSDCLSYTLPVKDPASNTYKMDTSKRKKFVTQYKGCYLKNMNEAFNSFIQLGNAPSLAKDDPNVKHQLIKNDCSTLIGSLIDYNQVLTSKNAYEYFKAFSSRDKNIDRTVSNYDYQKSLSAALLSRDGNTLKNYIRRNIDFFGDFEQALINCNSVVSGGITDCVDMAMPTDSSNNPVSVINSDNYSFKFGEDNTYSSSFQYLMPMVSTSEKWYIRLSQKELQYRGSPIPNIVSFPLMDEGKTTLREDPAGISKIMDEMVDGCVKDAESRFNLFAAGQEKKNQKYINEQKIASAKKTADAEVNVRTQTPGSEYSPQKATISNDVVTLADTVQNELNKSMNISSNFLQPTGDLFIDPIKMFVATLLKEGSKKALEGMFKAMFPTNSIDADISGLYGVDSVNNSGSGEAPVTGSCISPGPIKKGQTCSNNGQCYSCYCETRGNAVESSAVGASSNWFTCQDGPEASYIK